MVSAVRTNAGRQAIASTAPAARTTRRSPPAAVASAVEMIAAPRIAARSSLVVDRRGRLIDDAGARHQGADLERVECRRRADALEIFVAAENHVEAVAPLAGEDRV